jgi:hypothetical protein
VLAIKFEVPELGKNLHLKCEIGITGDKVFQISCGYRVYLKFGHSISFD